MKPLIWIAAVFAALCFECDGQALSEIKPGDTVYAESGGHVRRYVVQSIAKPLIASQSLLAASQAADAVSSRGLIETNPLLGRGPFGARQESIKGVATVGVIIAEWLIVRRWPGTARGFTWANYLTGAATFGVAGRNWGLR